MNVTSCASYQTASSALLQEFGNGHHDEHLPLTRALTWPRMVHDNINNHAITANEVLVEMDPQRRRSLPTDESRRLQLARVLGHVLALLDEDDFFNDDDDNDDDDERDCNSRTGDEEDPLALQEQDDDEDDEDRYLSSAMGSAKESRPMQ